jgi:hypothetical protein
VPPLSRSVRAEREKGCDDQDFPEIYTFVHRGFRSEFKSPGEAIAKTKAIAAIVQLMGILP